MTTVAPFIDFLIIAPLREERDALLALLPSLHPLPPVEGDISVYHAGSMTTTFAGGTTDEYSVVVTSPLGMGRVKAANAAQRGIPRWRPRYILVVGLAAGARRNKVGLGDVLVAEQIYDYELQKIKAEETGYRPEPFRVDARLLAAAQQLPEDRWQPHLTERRPDRRDSPPRVHLGPIASGDKIVADVTYWDDLYRLSSKLIGLEMEAGGVASAAHESEPAPGFFMVRGVCDLGDGRKNDRWRPYARAAAAAYAVALLSSGPIPSRSAPTPSSPDPSPLSGETLIAPTPQSAPAAGYGNVNITLAAITHFSEQQASVIGDLTVRELDALREAAREGRRGDALAQVAAIRSARVRWDSLAPAIRARVLHLEARILLDEDGDIAAARRRAEDIRALDPASATLLDAQLAYRAGNPTRALDLIAGRADADALHLSAVLHLVLGDRATCLACLDRVATAGETTAETHRLRALACLARGNLSAAESALGEATRLAPRWIVVRQARASLDYWRALSPVALPTGLVAWPLPPDWFLVRRDNASRAALSSAAETFGALAAEASPPAEQREYRRWELACVSNDPERQGEATELCRALLGEEPSDPCALAWCRARGWTIEAVPGEAALLATVEAGTVTVAQLTGLVVFLAGAERAVEAAQILDRPGLRDRLDAEGAADHWERLRAYAAAHSGDLHRAKVGTSTRFASVEDLHARSVALLTAARRRPTPRAWDKLLRHLARSHRDTDDPDFRLLRCRVLADLERWTEVAEEAGWLVAAVATLDALRLAAFATLRAGQYDRCLDLLATHARLCPGGVLTDDLRQLRISALRASGRLIEAIAEAETRAREGGGTRELLDLAQLHLERGDRREFGRIARQLVGRADLAPEAALRVAGIASLDERDVARRLATPALAAPLHDAALGDALAASARLGLDRQMGQLLNRAVASGGGAGLRVLDDDEAIAEWQRAWRWATDVEDRYRLGEVPIHFLPGNLAVRYRAQLARHEVAPDPLHQPPLYIRAGVRQPPAGDTDAVGKGRQLLDLTALLLAAHLDLLDSLVARFGTLYISPSVPTALHALRAEIAPQLERAEARREVRRLLDRSLLGSVPSTTGSVPESPSRESALQAQNTQAEAGTRSLIIVNRVGRTEGSAGATITTADLVRSLRRAGLLTAEQLRTALERLGEPPMVGASSTALPAVVTPDPQPKQPLLCDADAAQSLAYAGFLEAACRRWQVMLSASEAEVLRAAVVAEEEGQQLADWLADLQDRVSDGLGPGTFAIARARPPGPDWEDSAEDQVAHPVVRCIEELLRAEQHPDDRVWVDDRFLSRYERVEAAPLIGILDILADLEANGTIDTADRWGKVGRLRAGNARFLPLTEEELLHHLLLAPSDGGKVVETPELATLRRSFAACLVQHSALRRPDPTKPEDMGELAFVFDSRRAVAGAIVQAWANALTEQEAATRAAWLLENLYLDPLAMYTAVDVLRPDHDRRMIRALGLADVFAGAIAFRGAGTASVRERRRAFFSWIDERLMVPQCRADPALLAIVANYLASLIIGLIDSEEDKSHHAIVMASWQLWHEDLPGRLDDALAAHPDYLARLGLARRKLKRLADLTFDGTSADRALAAAMRGREATIRALAPPIPVTFSPIDVGDEVPRCRLTRGDTHLHLTIAHPELALYRGTPAARAVGLRRAREWFDTDEATREAAIAEIASLPLPRDRLAALDHRRGASAAWHFASLTQRVWAREEVTLADLLPRDAAGLLQHFRLPTDDPRDESFTAVLDRSARSLLASEGLVEAILRLAGIPVPMPESLRRAVAALGAAERRELLRALLGASASPPALAQIARVLLDVAGDDPAAVRLVRWFLRRAVGPDGLAACGAFVAILGWVGATLGEREETLAWSPRVRLAVAWGCADRLYRITRGSDIPADAIEEAFLEAPGSVRAWLTWDPEVALDLAYPRHLRPLALLAGACAYTAAEAPSTRDQREPAAAIPAGGERSRVVPGDWDSRWRAVALVSVGTEAAPHFDLLRHLGTAGNSLGSWFAGPWGDWLADRLAPAGDLIRPAVQYRELAALAGAAPSETNGDWGALVALLGELSPPPDCAGALTALLGHTDYVSVARRDPPLGLLALRLASWVARVTGDATLRAHIRAQLLAVASTARRESLGG